MKDSTLCMILEGMLWNADKHGITYMQSFLRAIAKAVQVR
jgi:hypothetical protein